MKEKQTLPRKGGDVGEVLCSPVRKNPWLSEEC